MPTLFPYTTLFRSKQKTAYEIHASDWSSDVCSSDLAWVSLPKARAGRGRPAKVHGYPPEGAGGVGAPAEAYGYPPEGAGGVGEAGEVSG